jgi:putative transposase
MPRRAQFLGEYIYHVMNRAAKRVQLFDSNADYIAAERLLQKAKTETAMRLLDYCIMPNHFHLVIWPKSASQMSQFMRTFTGTHAQCWQLARGTVGSGAVYQGRYKAIPVQAGRNFYNVCRYVQRNPLRAGLVTKAEEWRWSSLWRRLHAEDKDLLEPWPIRCPDDWLEVLNAPTEPADMDKVRKAINLGIPFGDPEWIEKTAEVVGLKRHLRSRGRPRKPRENCTRPLIT